MKAAVALTLLAAAVLCAWLPIAALVIAEALS